MLTLSRSSINFFGQRGFWDGPNPFPKPFSEEIAAICSQFNSVQFHFIVPIYNRINLHREVNKLTAVQLNPVQISPNISHVYSI